MAKFKLIKTYPGSPELGEIEEVSEIFYHCKYGSHGRYLYDINKYPEFWEKQED